MFAIPQELDQALFGVSANNIGIFFIIILLTFILRSLVLYIIDHKITALVEKTDTELDDHLIKAVNKPLSYFILVQGFYIATLVLQLSDSIDGFINKLHLLLVLFIVLYFIFRIIDVLAFYLHREAEKSESSLDDQLVPLLIKSLRILVFTLGILFILDNFGYNIASILAGLGIGGLAFALAAQDTVSNIFGSITIFADKPFKLGDWIRIRDSEGTVEDIGFRSTRIRRFDQALVTIPNSHFTKNGIINYSAMKKRRIKFNLGLTYGTSVNQMREMVAGIKKIIIDDDRFDHSFYMVKFDDFGAYSLGIFIYCFTKTIVWDEFLGVREDFNLKIMELVEDIGVEIAFPSQTVYLDDTRGNI